MASASEHPTKHQLENVLHRRLFSGGTDSLDAAPPLLRVRLKTASVVANDVSPVGALTGANEPRVTEQLSFEGLQQKKERKPLFERQGRLKWTRS